MKYMKKKNRKKLEICLIVILPILSILLPIFFHILYYFPAKSEFFIALISIDGLLEYSGTTIGSIFLFFTVYLTIRNTKKDLKLEKIRESMAEYLSIISPYTAVSFIGETKISNRYCLLKDFLDAENQKYQLLMLYLADDDKKILADKFDTTRLELIEKFEDILNKMKSSTEQNLTEVDYSDDFSQLITLLANLLKCSSSNFTDILKTYETSIF